MGIKTDRIKEDPNDTTITELDRITRLKSQIDVEKLNKEEKQELLKLISEYPYEFNLKGDKLGKTKLVQQRIYTTDDILVNLNPHSPSPRVSPNRSASKRSRNNCF